jgi:O-acetyl-ADP-ribose deacetylase (regulator of RNase III)
MIAQAGYGVNNLALHQTNEPNSTPPIRHLALETCLGKVAELAKRLGASVHMPRIGTGLGGSSWSIIEPIVSRQLSGLPVTVYDYAP